MALNWGNCWSRWCCCLDCIFFSLFFSESTSFGVSRKRRLRSQLAPFYAAIEQRGQALLIASESEYEVINDSDHTTTEETKAEDLSAKPDTAHPCRLSMLSCKAKNWCFCHVYRPANIHFPELETNLDRPFLAQEVNIGNCILYYFGGKTLGRLQLFFTILLVTLMIMIFKTYYFFPSHCFTILLANFCPW